MPGLVIGSSLSFVGEGWIGDSDVGGQTIAVGQVIETNLAQAIGRLKTASVAQALESGLAQSLTSRKTLTASQIAETDVAQAVSTIKTLLIGQTSETDAAQTVTVVVIAKADAIWQPRMSRIRH